MKIVNKNTEEIFGFNSDVCKVIYQKDNYSPEEIKVFPLEMFVVNDGKYVNFEGYEFQNWLEPEWPLRATFTDGQVTEIVSNENYKPWYDSLFVEPKNPFYRANGLVVIYFRVIEDEARALLESMGIAIQEKQK